MGRVQVFVSGHVVTSRNAAAPGFVPLRSDQDFSCVLLTWVGCRSVQNVPGDGVENGPSSSTVSVLNPDWHYCQTVAFMCAMLVVSGFLEDACGSPDREGKEAWPNAVALSASLFVSQLFLTMVSTCLKSILQLVLIGGRKAVTLSFILLPSD